MGVLRFFLALSVLTSHIRPKEHNFLPLLEGGVSVLIFFMISGFYISMVLQEKYLARPGGRARFFANRALRIFPLYLCALLLTQIQFSYDGMKSVFTDAMNYTTLTHSLLLFMNLFKLGQDTWQTLAEVFRENHGAAGAGAGLLQSLELFCLSVFGERGFVTKPGTLLIGQGWSLASELTYYFIAPFLVLSFWKRALSLAILSLALRFGFLFALGERAYMGSLRGKFFLSIFVFFMMGHLSYWIYRQVYPLDRAGVPAPLWRRKAEWASVLVWSGVLVFTLPNHGLFLDSDYDSGQLWLFYLCAMVSLPFLFEFTRTSRLDGWIGEFCYPIYLLHPIVIQFDFLHLKASPLGHFTNILAGVLLLSFALILVVERPLQLIRQKIARA